MMIRDIVPPLFFGYGEMEKQAQSKGYRTYYYTGYDYGSGIYRVIAFTDSDDSGWDEGEAGCCYDQKGYHTVTSSVFVLIFFLHFFHCFYAHTGGSVSEAKKIHYNTTSDQIQAFGVVFYFGKEVFQKGSYETGYFG